MKNNTPTRKATEVRWAMGAPYSDGTMSRARAAEMIRSARTRGSKIVRSKLTLTISDRLLTMHTREYSAPVTLSPA